MIDSRKIPVTCPPPRRGIRSGVRRLQFLLLSQPRLISNLLALVALFSIGFV
ncbi:MAG: hypothetical protein HIU85_01360 [Proteobacteria bacterium]|nr:hypothetical protein [Pseudomonadota bacterium]